jgi:hypothetical protein
VVGLVVDELAAVVGLDPQAEALEAEAFLAGSFGFAGAAPAPRG